MIDESYQMVGRGKKNNITYDLVEKGISSI